MRQIMVGTAATDLELRAAELLQGRAETRGVEAAVVRESGDTPAAPTVVIGTAASSASIRDLITSGRLTLPPDLGDEGFVLVAQDDTAVLCARDPRGLVFGVGELLRRSAFSEGTWTMRPTTLTTSPDKQRRPIYFATHFGNWYCHAEMDELREYVEDLALAGYNELVTWFDLHHYRDFGDGAAVWQRLAELDRLARGVGMGVGRVAIANESFQGQAPAGLGATGRLAGTGYETDLCPSQPAGREIILANRRAFLERIRDTTQLDWLCLWPYDQGGCNCETCTPWPTTYMELCRELAQLGREVLPDTETLVSAWWIGTHVEGEDDAFFSYLARGETWFDTIVAGTVELRRWLADGRKVPPPYDVLLFPEISMFDSLPWGSRGANPAPRRFTAEMQELGEHIGGAMPYSEGRYEDLNKFLWARMQWDPALERAAVLEDYCRLAFGDEVAVHGAQLLLDMEAELRELSLAAQVHEQAMDIDRRMPAWARGSWRWEIVRGRTALDALREQMRDPSASAERRSAAEADAREVYDHLQRDLFRHDERSLWGWIHLPFDEWVRLPLNELVLPTGVGSILPDEPTRTSQT